ncbi:undecaprenyl-diphosphate phosphatase, partial [Oenococcus oeni]
IAQGVSELFPISSVAHSVIIPYLFGWKLSPFFLKTNFLEFVVMMHIGTTISLIVYFRKDWKKMLKSLFNKKTSKRNLALIVIGTIPAIILGAIFEQTITNAFSDVIVASIFLIFNGLLLFFGEQTKKRGNKS